MKKFKSNLVMFLIFIAYFAITIILFMKTAQSGGGKGALVLGIIMSIVYALVCFINKRLRSKMTIWWGILSLASGIWWIYLLAK